MVGGHERELVATGVECPARTENEWVYRVYDVRSEALQSASDTGVRRADAHLWVRRERDAKDPVYRSASVGFRSPGWVSGREYKDLVPYPP